MTTLALFSWVLSNTGNSKPIAKFESAQLGKNGQSETSILKLIGYILVVFQKPRAWFVKVTRSWADT